MKNKSFFVPLLTAMQFLTILPVKVHSDKEDFGRSLAWFPFVGAIIGTMLAFVFLISYKLPTFVIASLILIASFLITGGIHLDGFADTCDGLYGLHTKEKALEIMRDSHIGAIGAISLILILLFKFSLLSSINQDILWRYLILMPVFSRFMQSFACFSSSSARQDGKAKYFIECAGRKEIVFGLAFTLLLSYFLLNINGLILFFVSFLPILILMQYIRKRINGMTGDTIGAVNEISEAVFLFVGLVIIGIRVMG